MARWQKRVLAVLCQYDYGVERRGPSLEQLHFLPALRRLAADVEPLWIDEAMRDRARLQRMLIDRADRYRPDLVFFMPTVDEFAIETLDALRRRYVTYAWFGDDQWRFDGYTSVYAPHYTRVSTTDPFSLQKYRAIGIEPIVTQWAGPRPDKPAAEPEAYRYQISFVGGYNTYRDWFVRRLASGGVPVACFGSGWPNGRVTQEEMTSIFRSSRINLNMSNSVNPDVRFVAGALRNLYAYLRSPKRAEQMKARNFEIPLAGGFQLTNYVAGLEDYFAVGSEVAIYTTPEECLRQIGRYLEQEGLRQGVRVAGQQRAVRDHTYDRRLEDVLDAIWDAPQRPAR